VADHDAHGPAISVITRVMARARDDSADDEVTARHILTALIGHGWRLTNAQPAPPAGPAVPATAEFRAARAAIERHADHGADVTCRPAGNGLCEPYSGAAEVTG
jgi:hypothetical protein